MCLDGAVTDDRDVKSRENAVAKSRKEDVATTRKSEVYGDLRRTGWQATGEESFELVLVVTKESFKFQKVKVGSRCDGGILDRTLKSGGAAEWTWRPLLLLLQPAM